MISFVRGILEEVNLNSIVIDCGGIGYEILVSTRVLGTLPKIGDEHKIYTYMDVKEDSMSLFGFETKYDRELFKNLISVSGVGPKGALAIMSELGANELVSAIIAGDSKAISKSKGIGQKTAQKIVIELKDKVSLTDIMLDNSDNSEIIKASDFSSDNLSEAVEALVVLGISNTDALKAVRRVEDRESLSVEELIKKALKKL